MNMKKIRAAAVHAQLSVAHFHRFAGTLHGPWNIRIPTAFERSFAAQATALGTGLKPVRA